MRLLQSNQDSKQRTLLVLITMCVVLWAASPAAAVLTMSRMSACSSIRLCCCHDVRTGLSACCAHRSDILLADEDKEKDDAPKTKMEKRKTEEWEQLNTQNAIWLRDPSDVTPEEYEKFYQAVAKVLLWRRLNCGLLHGSASESDCSC